MGQNRLGGVGPLAMTGDPPIVRGDSLEGERLPRADGAVLPAGTGDRFMAQVAGTPSCEATPTQRS